MRVVPVILAVALTGTPVAASDTEVEHIDAIMHDALADLQAVHDDAVTPVQCRAYTDALMTTLDILDDAAERPDSFFTGQLLGLMLAPLAKARNDCLLAT